MGLNEQELAVLPLAQLPEGTMRCLRAGGRRLLLAHSNGRIFATDEMCSHEEWTLCNGALRDGKVTCSLHGSRFDLATGAPLDEPADMPIATYPTRLVDGVVHVTLPT